MDSGGLYPDLMEELASRGHSVIVIKQDETRIYGTSELSTHNNVSVYSIPTGKLTKVNLFIKAINLFLFEKRFYRGVSKIKFDTIDLLIYSTPPINFLHTVMRLKEKYNPISYLLLKDIFPQNAVDLHIMKKKSILYKLNRSKEKKLYKSADIIGCMSPANVAYIKNHNMFLTNTNIHVSPNCIKPSSNVFSKENTVFSNKLNIIYGGNLGKPQGISFLLEIISLIETKPDISLTIVGNGTEFLKINNYIRKKKIKNTQLFPFMDKTKYLHLLRSMDVGLILLDCRFTIPNFPSRVLDYLDNYLPVLACTDIYSDIKDQICDKGAGLWSVSDDIDKFEEKINYLINNKKLLIDMGLKAKELLLSQYSCKIVVDIIENKYLEIKDKRIANSY